MREGSEVYTAVKVQVEVFWVVIPCSTAVGYQRFGRPCCLHLQGEVNDTGKKGMDIGIKYTRGDRVRSRKGHLAASRSELVYRPCL
jgi:hypothetical protein